MRRLALVVLLLLAGCSSSSTPATEDVELELDGRPFRLHVPSTAPDKAPLVVLLHGYTSSADEQESYFQLTAESDRRGFLYATPEGTTDQRGERFWNATPACCDFYRSGVDDSAYLARLIDTVAAKHPIDPARVYFVGHSNGGFMALRMACDHADRVTAVVSLAGAATADPAACEPARPVSVLQIHGTSDRTILYEGSTTGGRRYPAAKDTVALWRGLDGCADRAGTAAAPIDLDSTLPGAETTVTSWHEGCRDGTRAELWSIEDGSHIPALTPTFATAVVDFLLARSAPAR
ncbi:alpha/beta hydrolase family esterase [Phytohabitans sp. LJ34]|uniref:alpha/beta hydrolase family esterase n=1 Tax=Phytohabitans sp. LJ34 TaxID=3452217 RepID=UPI003F8C03F3